MPVAVYRKTSLMRMIERTYGRPIEDVVIAAFNGAGTYDAAAETLGVAVNTLRDNWMPAMGIHVRTIAEKDTAERNGDDPI